MDTSDLVRFLLEANQHGYAAGRAARQRREGDHSTTIVYENGDWTLHDNFFGGEPYGGRSVVSRKGAPVWMVVYYGYVDGPASLVQPVYSFLQRALLLAPDEFPVRGPGELVDDPFTYRRVHRGDVGRFWGEETIHHRGHRGQPAYTAWFSGGLVDQRRGD
jgi:hypothetical protein